MALRWIDGVCDGACRLVCVSRQRRPEVRWIRMCARERNAADLIPSDHLHPLFSEGYLVDTFQLKKNDPSGEYVESVRQVTKTCSIKGVHYVVRIRGVPGAGRLGKDQSHCREC